MAILYRDEAQRLAAEVAKLKGREAGPGQDFLNARLRDQLVRLKKKTM
jgi:hypothetical protein